MIVGARTCCGSFHVPTERVKYSSTESLVASLKSDGEK